jgi:hypothetical protein
VIVRARSHSVIRNVCGVITLTLSIVACAPRITIPPVPARVPYAADSVDILLARQLAPVLYLQRDEPFSLRRVIAVLHPTRPLIGYRLLWNHDVNGQWMPWTKATDIEAVWVQYDPRTRAPTKLWTYWHGVMVCADWRGKGTPSVIVQWGKHGTLPYGTIVSDLPKSRKMNVFYALEFFLIPDIVLGKIQHGGPFGFFRGYRRYREFSRVMPLSGRLDAVARGLDPGIVQTAVFGPRHANKQHWPEEEKDSLLVR